MNTKRLALIASLGCALIDCSWSNYDGNYDAGTTTTLDTNGGRAISDDQLFVATFPPGSLTTTTQIVVSRVVNSESYCQGNNGACVPQAYTVTMRPSGSTSSLVGPVQLAFNMQNSANNFPLVEAFMVKPGPQVMPGSWGSDGAVHALQGPDTQSFTLGPYVIAHIPGRIGSTNACSNGMDNACDTCALSCCANQGYAPPHSAAGFHEACMCQGPSPGTENCLAGCLKTAGPSGETCQ